jgi:hypothetical protein
MLSAAAAARISRPVAFIAMFLSFMYVLAPGIGFGVVFQNDPCHCRTGGGSSDAECAGA